MNIWVVWFALALGAFAVFETRAFLDRKDGTTLSANIWRWRQRAAFRAVAGAAVAWLLWHLAAPWDNPEVWWDDYTAIGAGLLLGLSTRYKPRRGA